MFKVDGNAYNYGYIGSRATGVEAGSYLVLGPDWKVEIPAGINKVFQSATPFALTIFRTQLFKAEDMPNVLQVQAGYKAEHKAAVLLAMKEGDDKIDKFLSSGMKNIDGWKVGSVFGDGAFYNGDWLKRAAAAKGGIYGTMPLRPCIRINSPMLPGMKTKADGSLTPSRLTLDEFKRMVKS